MQLLVLMDNQRLLSRQHLNDPASEPALSDLAKVSM